MTLDGDSWIIVTRGVEQGFGGGRAGSRRCLRREAKIVVLIGTIMILMTGGNGGLVRDGDESSFTVLPFSLLDGCHFMAVTLLY